MRHYRALLFDLDGTLTDPKVGITRSVQYALGKLGIAVEDPDCLTAYIGPPLREAFRTHHGLSEEESHRALSFYRESYERTGMMQNLAYPGVAELLRDLQRQGRRLFVATSKPRVYAQKILAGFGMERYFASIEGSEMDGTRSDKAELIRFVLGTHALEKASTVMIGDRMHDVAGAARNGVDSIAVGYGYGSRDELAAARPTHYAETLSDLAALLLPPLHDPA